jgi:hypothetical protein
MVEPVAKIPFGTRRSPTRCYGCNIFEPTVMFFGLCNSLATFQAMMNNIFRNMLNEGWLIIYMDDILIYSDDPEEHRK